MKSIKKTLLHIIIVALAVAVVMTFGNAVCETYATVNDSADGVVFAEPYALEGKPLTVKYDGNTTNLQYKWYINGELIPSEESESFNVEKAHYEKTIVAEVWVNEAKVGETSMFCSKLPVLYIDTEGEAEVTTKEYYIYAQMHLQGNDLYNSKNTTLYTGATEIKGRGNSTWEMFPKKPYKLKLDKKTNLFGMGKNKHWVLLANYIDESNMRNMLATNMANQMKVGAMDGVWVEVIMNGKPLGTYMLCEHVRLSEDRVDVFDWESAGEDIAEAIADANGFVKDDKGKLTDQMVEEDMSWISSGEVTFGGKTYKIADYYENIPTSFSGGYLMEMDYGYDEVSKFTTDNGATLMFKSPEFIYTDKVAMDSVKNYIQVFEDALYSKDFCTDVDGKKVSYTEFCDVESFANFWLASEMLMNEIGCKSTYFHKEIDQPIEFGPIWDFDFSSGSVSPFSAQNACDWTSDNKYWNGAEEKWWFEQAMKDPYFAVKARELYVQQEDYFKSVVAEDGLLEQWYGYLYEAGTYNHEIWQYARGFEADYEALDSWLTERISWMDKQFATNESAMRSLGVVLDDNLKLQLNGSAVDSNGYKSYVAKAGSDILDLSVNVEGDEYTELNYYINSKYQGTVSLTDGKANIVVREELLTEDIGKNNVITVWTKDKNGELSQKQYVTVKLISDETLYNVIFNDMEGTHSLKVIPGEKVCVPEPLKSDESYAFEGWSDGDKTYKEGDWVVVNGDVKLNAVWATCSDGTYSHDFAEKDGMKVCLKDNCSVSKSSDKKYIDVTACVITCSNRYSNDYTGKAITPKVTLTYDGETLVQGEHYALEYKNNVNVGYATYVVKGVKSAGYKGTFELSYRILPCDITKTTITAPSSCVLKNGVAKPAVKIIYNGKKLIEGVDYIVTFSGNETVGTGTMTIEGKGNFTGTVTKTFEVVKTVKSISKCTFGTISTKTYTGSTIEPAITVKDGSRKLVQGADYEVIYSNNVKCGTASVKIKGVTNSGYSGTKTVTFNIRPDKAIPTVKNVKYNEQKVTWNKVAGATEYKIYKSTNNKNFKLVKTVKASSSRTYTSKGLDAGITYYYKVRAVVTSGKTIYWGLKSDAVKLKTVLYKGKITSAKNIAKRTVVLKWTGVNGAHGYKIYRSETGKGDSFKLIVTTKKVTKYKNTNLKKGKTYYYKIKPYRKVNGKNVYGTTSAVVKVKVTK